MPVKRQYNGLIRQRKNAEYLRKHAIRIGMLSSPDPKPAGKNPNAKAKGSNGRTGKLTVGEVGAIHERGIGVPERSFIKWVSVRKKPELFNTSSEWLEAMNRSRNVTPKHVLIAVSERFIQLSQERIQSKIPPKLAASTLKQKKGKATPLINRGQLVNSIRAKIIPSDQAFKGG
jgi:hypothetical protein